MYRINNECLSVNRRRRLKKMQMLQSIRCSKLDVWHPRDFISHGPPNFGWQVSGIWRPPVDWRVHKCHEPYRFITYPFSVLSEIWTHRPESLYLARAIFVVGALKDLVTVEVFRFQSPPLLVVIPALLSVLRKSPVLTPFRPIIPQVLPIFLQLCDAITIGVYQFLRNGELPPIWHTVADCLWHGTGSGKSALCGQRYEN